MPQTTTTMTRSSDRLKAHATPLAQVPALGTAAERLRWLRERSGDTPVAVGTAIGLSRTAYVQYESGSSKLTLEKVEGLAEHFKIAPEWLAFGIGAPERHKTSRLAAKFATVVDRLIYLRERAGERPEATAAALGIVRTAYIRYEEQGQGKLTLERTEDLADHFRVSAAWLGFGVGEAPR